MEGTNPEGRGKNTTMRPEAVAAPETVGKAGVNYIREYFQGEGSRMPSVDLVLFQRKVSILDDVFGDSVVDAGEYLAQKYPLGQLQRKEDKEISRLKKGELSFMLKPTKQGISMYFGQIVQNKRQGYGVQVQFKQEKMVHMHEGYFKDNISNGLGFQLKDRVLYIGEFALIEAVCDEAVMLYPNGDVFLGEVVNGKKHGKGSYFKVRQDGERSQKERYQLSTQAGDYDEVVLGQWHGNGIVDRRDFSLDTSLASIFDGSGEKNNGCWLVMADSVYRGDLQQQPKRKSLSCELSFVREGRGSEYFSNGDVYQGEYGKDRPNGFGNYQWSSGDEYTGQFRDGIREGKGRWKGENGEQYEGQHVQDQRSGLGVYRWPSGQLYEGQFRADMREGQGKMVWENGEVYEGQWRQGKQSGEKTRPDFRSHRKIAVGSRVRLKERYGTEEKEHSHKKRRYRSEQKGDSLNSVNKDRNELNVSQQRKKGRSLVELKPLKKVPFHQQGSQSILHDSFYQKTQMKGNLSLKQTLRQKEKMGVMGLIGQKMPSEIVREIETKDEEEPLLGHFSAEVRPKRRQYRNVLKLKQMKPRETSGYLQMGQTLLRPIKWHNFKHY